jgi:hypothetical protein
MELLGDVGHVESSFGPFGDSVSFGAWFVPYVPSAKKLFWMHGMVLLGDKAQIEPHFGPFGAVLVSVQDRCMVCAKCSISSEIILDAPDGTPR